jgi:hypothetical protein
MKRAMTMVTLSLLPSLMAWSTSSSAASAGVLFVWKAALNNKMKESRRLEQS